MKAMLDLDPKDVSWIEDEAERLGVTRGELLRAWLTEMRTSHTPVAWVRRRVAEGWTDAEIAADMGKSIDRVGIIRRSLGLAPNRKFPKKTAA